ncbi:MAG: type III ribulose-bisphosphate carboxylase [Conexivisphaerales archaeon]
MEEKVEWYLDFVDFSYRAKNDDLIAKFKIKPAKGFSIDEAAGRVASESSVGTWTTLASLTPSVKELMAKAYKIDNSFVWVAYPYTLFEPGNMPQILSSIAGNIFGMKAIASLRLEDVVWPEKLMRSFKGPKFGVEGIRDLLKVTKRPLLASVPKPKLGLTHKEHAAYGYDAWIGGLDLLKDDENLTSQSFNNFEFRAKETFRMRDKAEKETGERKSYLINITSETKEMIRRAKLVKELGGEYVMIDIITSGWSALQTLRDVCDELGLAIHAHRAFHAAFTRSIEHGMSMNLVAEISRIIGVDQLHIGTVVGKLEASKEEVLTLKEKLTTSRNGWKGMKKVFPVSSGGLHVGLIPRLLSMLGTDIVVQVGGGVWGHPSGGRAGARALRDAIDSYMNNIPLDEYAKKSRELREALQKWGRQTYI